jgi:hypothetical protein
VLLVALSDPRSRLRGHNGELLPTRRWCAGCAGLISAWAPASDRFCWGCAPRVDDEPPLDPALYCKRGHLKAQFWVVIVDRSRTSGERGRCSECKRADDSKRDRSAEAKAERAAERPRRAA